MAGTAAKSDLKVQSDVMDELKWTPDVDSAGIGVSVHDGAVTLSGSVASLPERIAAGKAALRVRGVATVADDLVVETAGTPATDAHIADAVRSTVASLGIEPAAPIQATIRDGAVELTGTLEWNYQRGVVARAVANIAGVRHVEDRLALTDRPSAEDTSVRIRNALARNAALDAEKIAVTVNGTEVTLTGRVPSWTERKQAEHAAWASPAVTAVHNKIGIGLVSYE
ncbi:BON domain-containing protein [Arthrobacter sp. 35W]|uniref:BON domain-containing protein n=1 Tax=Arthrobacter sp. 35W TaxID=1132441 RepID=UPI00042A4BA9|nr:BON domain-containing protein [Arthrobacter sp. 35W]